MSVAGPYRLERELRRTASSAVYLATDSATGRPVELRILRPPQKASAGEKQLYLERVLQAAQAATQLSHPAIARVQGAFVEGELAYIVSEYAEGTSLEQWVESGEELQPELVLSVLRQTGEALDQAHQQGVVHGALSPAEIVVQEGGRAKVTGFGTGGLWFSARSHAMGPSGKYESYLSPEQAAGKPPNNRSDQFSLAAIAYELLSGEKPFVASGKDDLLAKIAKETAPPIHALNPTLSWAVNTVLQRALEKEPGARYSSCAEFIRALEAACRVSKGWQPRRLVGTTDAAREDTTESRVYSHEAPAGGSERKTRRAPRIPVWLVALGSALATLVVIGAVVLVLVGRGTRPPETGPAAQVLTTGTPSGRPSPAGPRVVEPGSATSETKEEGEEPAVPVPETKPIQPAERPGAKSEPPSKPEELITFRSMPSGARVVVDNDPERTCKAPCALSLSHGRHTVIAALEGYRAASRSFSVPQELDIALSLERVTGKLLVSSDPPGAVIFVDGVKQPGTTPATLSVSVGRRLVEVWHEKYGKAAQEIEVREGTLNSLSFTLRR